MRTVGELLREGTDRLRASGSGSARLDAELLVGHAVGMDRTGILAHPEAPVGDGQAARYEASLERRERGEPVAYIRGIKEFYGLALAVDPRGLIPRPETELVVDLAMEWIRPRLIAAPRPADAPPLRVWDVGTGSGAIAIALAVTLRRRGMGDDVRLVATDASSDAAGLALENAVVHGVADRVDVRIGDLAAALPADGIPVDLVCANLPYVASAAVPRLPVAASFEPVAALDGGPDGLDVIRRLLEELPAVIARDGCALLEIGADQADAAGSAGAAALPGCRATIHGDLAGRARVVRLAGAG
jgi:release factor glutamine methyltransferase